MGLLGGFSKKKTVEKLTVIEKPQSPIRQYVVSLVEMAKTMNLGKIKLPFFPIPVNPIEFLPDILKMADDEMLIKTAVIMVQESKKIEPILLQMIADMEASGELKEPLQLTENNESVEIAA